MSIQTHLPPTRGFPVTEFETRLDNAQRLMAEANLDALLLTTEPEVRYFTGFLTQFWQSPTRPWFLIVPRSGKPIAVIPAIGAEYMSRTWLDDVRTWPAPQPHDDGVSLLTETLLEVLGDHSSRCIGVPMGHESHLRMPLNDFYQVQNQLGQVAFVDATPLIQRLRVVKSEAEIAKIAYICDRVSAAFETLPNLLTTGQSQLEVFRIFKLECLRQGADDVAYLVGGAEQGGYSDIISPPSDNPTQLGDLLILDTGCLFDGYF
ncbi:MAG: aminopeptidase P family N-terminal domain-containing protein, partial [Chloroflexota bacterium]